MLASAATPPAVALITLTDSAKRKEGKENSISPSVYFKERFNVLNWCCNFPHAGKLVMKQ